MISASAIQPRRTLTLDWWTLAAALALMILGALFIHSARIGASETLTGGWAGQYWFRQVIWYGIGTAALAVTVLFDYRWIGRLAMPIYWACIVLLVLVLIPGVGTDQGTGARSWFRVAGFSIQPAEFAKLATIFLLASMLSHQRESLNGPGVLVKVGLLTLLPFALIIKQPDLGSALTFIPVAFAMVFVAGVPTRYLTRLSIAAAALIALVLVDVLFAPGGKGFVRLGDYQRHRLLVYFGMSFAPPHATEEERAKAVRLERERTYNIRQALISVGSGGLFGKGWGQGTQATLGFLPRNVSQSDFIFSVIAEESGYVGTVVVLGLYSVILFSGLRVAGQARDRLGKLLAVGIVALVFSHVFENIGMNIRLMPVTGIPLPLLSYGGSSVLCTLIAIGILQNVHLHRNQH